MAITRANLVTNFSSALANSYSTASITPPGSELITAWIVNYRASGGLPSQPTLSGNGLTYVAIDTQLFGGDTARLTCYRAMGASPSAGAVTIGMGGVNHNSCIWIIESAAGVDTSGTNGSGAVVQSAKNNNESASSLTVTLASAIGAANAVYGGFGQWAGSSATAGGSYTRVAQQLDAGDGLANALIYLLPGTTTPSASYAVTDAIAGIAIEVKEAGAAAIHYQRVIGGGGNRVIGGI